MDRVEPLITATSAEIAALGALCHASKGYWGYPAKWMALWAEELSVSHDAALRGDLAVVRDGTGFSAVAQLSCYQDQAELEKLFVAPHSIGRGLGRLLLNWAKPKPRDAAQATCGSYQTRMQSGLSSTARGLSGNGHQA